MHENNFFKNGDKEDKFKKKKKNTTENSIICNFIWNYLSQPNAYN